MAVIGLDNAVSFEYADIRVFLESKVQPIGPNDLWIATHARSMITPLVMNNIQNFHTFQI